jgi:hypothetical protein
LALGRRLGLGSLLAVGRRHLGEAFELDGHIEHGGDRAGRIEPGWLGHSTKQRRGRQGGDDRHGGQ